MLETYEAMQGLFLVKKISTPLVIKKIRKTIFERVGLVSQFWQLGAIFSLCLHFRSNNWMFLQFAANHKLKLKSSPLKFFVMSGHRVPPSS